MSPGEYARALRDALWDQRVEISLAALRTAIDRVGLRERDAALRVLAEALDAARADVDTLAVNALRDIAQAREEGRREALVACADFDHVIAGWAADRLGIKLPEED